MQTIITATLEGIDTPAPRSHLVRLVLVREGITLIAGVPNQHFPARAFKRTLRLALDREAPAHLGT